MAKSSSGTNPYQSPIPAADKVSAVEPQLASNSARPTRVRDLVLVLACAVSFLLYLHRYTWGFVKERMATEYGWDPVTLSTLDGYFVITYGAVQIPSGILCDWFGAQLMLGSSILLWSVALGGLIFAHGIASVAFARLALGVGQAGCYPALNKVSKNWFPLSMRTTAQSLIGTFFGRAGGAACFILFGTFMLGHWQMSWEWGIGIFSVLGIACGVLFLLVFRNTPREHPWSNEQEAMLIVADDPAAAQASGSRLEWRLLLRNSSIWLLMFRAIMSNMADVIYIYWIPTFLLTEKGLPHTDAGWLASIPLFGGAFGGAASGFLQSYLIRRTGNRRLARSGLGFAGKMIAAILLASSLSIPNPIVLATMFFFVKFFSDAEQPAEWGSISDMAGSNAATVFSVINTLGCVGGYVGGIVVGFAQHAYMADDKVTTASWTATFVIVAIEYVLASLAWLFIDCRKPLVSDVTG